MVVDARSISKFMRGIAAASPVLTLALCAAAPRSASADDGDSAEAVRRVSTTRCLLAFNANAGSSRITKIDVWFTDDHGESWKLDATRPCVGDSIAFEAPGDGLFGVFLVLHNAHGASSPPPAAGTRPHRWIRVDRSAPHVQVLEVRPDPLFHENRELIIRWEATDDDLLDRPVSVYFRTPQTGTYRLIADQLPAESGVRWVVPVLNDPRVDLKVEARDRTGNHGRSFRKAVTIDGPVHPSTIPSAPATPPQADPVPAPSVPAADDPPPVRRVIAEAPPVASSVKEQDGARLLSPEPAERPAAVAQAVMREPDEGSIAPDDATASAVDRIFRAATLHRGRGEHALALTRYREALKLDPARHDVRGDFASLLYVRGEYENAENEFRAILAADPNHRAALKSLALVQAARRQYRTARETLNRLLAVEDKDAEAWLYLGDVTMFLGDRVSARECWLKARSVRTSSAGVIERAEKRLAIFKPEQTALGLADEP